MEGFAIRIAFSAEIVGTHKYLPYTEVDNEEETSLFRSLTFLVRFVLTSLQISSMVHERNSQAHVSPKQ